ncbi:MAG: TlpA family protein disulfide reductase [Gemmatimonadaceae bacterium]|nr:TlpA family protein disulfide reductase [Gemmatimonadaceae bacterium]
MKRGLVGLLLAATVLVPRDAAAQLGVDVGVKAPDAALETLDGRPVTLAETIKGKVAVLEFWATWCSVCKELEPRMEAAQKKHAKDVVFVGVAVSANQSVERVRRYTAQHLGGFVHLYDRKGDAVGEYDVPATSYVVVVNKAGTVVYAGVGGTQDIEAAIQKALK